MMMTKRKVVNLYAGPGTGKSITCAALFAELKYRGIDAEMVLEYAKDATWEKRGEKVFKAQEYIFGKQSFRLSRVAEEVEITVTDSPILMGIAYMPPGYAMPALEETVRQAYRSYDNLDVFLLRTRPYESNGRSQTPEQAEALDARIKEIIRSEAGDVPYVPMRREAVGDIIDLMAARGWV